MSHTTESSSGNTTQPANTITPIKQNLPIKLTGSNFLASRAHLSALLNGLKLSHHLNPALTPAVKDSAAYPDWFQQDQCREGQE